MDLVDTNSYEPVPCAIDRIATQNPEKPFISIPFNDDVESGYRDISFSVFSRAVNRCSWWLRTEFRQSKSFETLSYCGPQDLRYLILILASVKTGYNILLCHPLTTAEDYLSLLQTSQCKIFLYSTDTVPLAQSILRNRDIGDVLVAPPLEDWLCDLHTPDFRYSKTMAQAWEDPFAMVVSSGSTGVPKPIQITHGAISTMAQYQKIPRDRPSLFQLWSGLRILLNVPLSLAVGVFCMLSVNIYFDWTVVLPPTKPVTAELLNSIHEHANVQVSSSLPAIFPDLTASDAYLNTLARLKYVAFTGGQCPYEVGAKIASVTRLTTLLGSSETGPIPTELVDPQDWMYTKFSAFLPHQLQHVHEDIYELVIDRGDDRPSRGKVTQDLQPVFCTYPDLMEFRTRDLYSKHPTDEDVWLYQGRRDDLIELSIPHCSSPRLMFPIPMEKMIEAHPDVKFAMVYGTGQPRPALLLQPREPASEQEYQSLSKKFIEDVVWPIVRKANQGYPAYCQVLPSMIQVTKPGKPMSLTTKLYVSRKKTTQLYQSDMESLY